MQVKILQLDKELPLPKLFFPSIQINLNGGTLPDKESNGIRYINIESRLGWLSQQRMMLRFVEDELRK